MHIFSCFLNDIPLSRERREESVIPAFTTVKGTAREHVSLTESRGEPEMRP